MNDRPATTSAPPATATQRDPGDILASGLGITVAMWACGYISRLPALHAPAAVLFALLLLCLLVGGLLTGRFSPRGWKAGAGAGALSALLNLLVLGGALASPEDPNRIVPAALWWIPGWLLASTALTAAGAWIGARRPASASPHWPTALAAVTTLATALLLVVGGLVTSHEAGLAVPDWPTSFGYNMFLYPLSRMTGGIYYEHAHRLFGSLVGLASLILAAYFQWREPRRWLRRLTWTAFVLVCIQGVLGGLRVTGRLVTSPDQPPEPNVVLAVVHGVLAQLFLALMVAITTFCTPTWRHPGPSIRPTRSRTNHTLSALLLAALIVQLVLGALLRHLAWGVLTHIVVAVAVILLAALLGIRLLAMHNDLPILRRTAAATLALVLVQTVLGVAALMTTGVMGGMRARPAVEVTVATAHQAGGAAVLVCALLAALWIRRLLQPPAARASS